MKATILIQLRLRQPALKIAYMTTQRRGTCC